MTRTSPDARSPRAGRSARPFLAAVTGVTLCLAAVSGLLTASALERGPRVRTAVGDTALTVQRPGVTLGIRADQPLADTSTEGVRVEPPADVDVEVDGSTLRVRFLSPLDFGTDYRIVAPSLRGRTTGAAAAAEFAFRTPPLTVTTLERGGAYDRAGGEDRIVRHDVLSGDESTLFSAPRIQEYAVDGDSLVALVRDEAGRAVLRRVGADGTTSLAAPGDGTVGLVRVSADAARVGFVYSGPGPDGTSYLNTLFTLDPEEPGARPQPVRGVGGIPLLADAWFFLPGSSYLVAQSPDTTLTLVDASGAAPARRLGEVGALRAVLPGATSVVVEGPTGTAILDLTDGSLTPAPVSSPVGEISAGSLVVSPTSSLSWDAATVRLDDGSERSLFTVAPGERIDEVCLAPSGRHVLVGTVPAGAVVDGYPARAEWVGRTSTVVEVATGARVATLAGTRPSWCD